MSNGVRPYGKGSPQPLTVVVRFPGWSVVWVAFVMTMFSAGVGTYGPSLYLQTLHASRDWPIAGVSAAVTTHFLSSAAVVVFLPNLHCVLGLALTTAGGGVLIATGLCAWGSAEWLWQLFPAAVLSGAGFALIGGAAATAIVSQWFDRDRPKALSTALNGASVGGIVFAPVWIFLIDRVGFQTATAIVAALIACIIVLLAFRFLRHGPNDYGLALDGGSASAHSPDLPPASSSSRWTLLRDQRFRSLSLPFALGLFATIGILSQFVVRLVPDVGKDGAAALLSLATGCSLLGRTALGWTIGRHDRRLAAAVNFAVQAAGVALLAVSDRPILLMVGTSLFGFGIGNLTSLPPLIAQAEFKPADVGTIVALVTAVNQAVFGLAPLVLGFLHDFASGYTVPFALAFGLQLAAMSAMLAGRPTRQSQT